MSARNSDLRRRVSKMKLLGWGASRIAAVVKISNQRASQLLRELDANGVQEFIKPKYHRGLDIDRARAILETELAREPWTVGNWTCTDVVDMLHARGVEISPSSVSNLLHRMGYRTRWVRVAPEDVKESA